MLKCMTRVIPSTNMDAITALIDAGQFIDGKRTAGHRARLVKNNLLREWAQA